MYNNDIVAVVATDELIMDAWIEKANEYIAELESGMQKSLYNICYKITIINRREGLL